MANYADWYGTAADLPTDRAMGRSLEQGRSPGASSGMFGTVEETVAEVEAMKAMGVSSLLYFATFPGMRPSATIPYFEKLAKEVMPQFS